MVLFRLINLVGGGVKDDTSDDTMVADSLENKGTAEIPNGFHSVKW